MVFVLLEFSLGALFPTFGFLRLGLWLDVNLRGRKRFPLIQTWIDYPW